MQEQNNQRVCKQCLVREIDEAAYREKLEKVLLLMDRNIKADTALYEKRLSICKECEKLLEGTCLGCGCYVELRAAAKSNHCPYKKW